MSIIKFGLKFIKLITNLVLKPLDTVQITFLRATGYAMKGYTSKYQPQDLELIEINFIFISYFV